MEREDEMERDGGRGAGGGGRSLVSAALKGAAVQLAAFCSLGECVRLGGLLQKWKVIWPKGKWNWEKWRIQYKHLVPDLALDQGSPKWNALQFHLSFPAAPQVVQRFKCTQDTHQKMESQIT